MLCLDTPAATGRSVQGCRGRHEALSAGGSETRKCGRGRAVSSRRTVETSRPPPPTLTCARTFLWTPDSFRVLGAPCFSYYPPSGTPDPRPVVRSSDPLLSSETLVRFGAAPESVATHPTLPRAPSVPSGPRTHTGHRAESCHPGAVRPENVSF